MKLAFHRKLPGHSLEDQMAITRSIVSDDRYVWIDGRGAETVHTMTNTFRDRLGPHFLYLGMDVRVLGDTQADITNAVHALGEYGVKIIDLSHPEDNTDLKLYRRAQDAMRWNGDRRQQKRKGSKGGSAKGAAAQARRDAQANRDLVIRLCAHPKLTWKDRAQISGICESTLQRHYKF